MIKGKQLEKLREKRLKEFEKRHFKLTLKEKEIWKNGYITGGVDVQRDIIKEIFGGKGNE